MKLLFYIWDHSGLKVIGLVVAALAAGYTVISEFKGITMTVQLWLPMLLVVLGLFVAIGAEVNEAWLAYEADEVTMSQFQQTTASLQTHTERLGEIAQITTRMAFPLDEVEVRITMALKFDRALNEFPVLAELLKSESMMRMASSNYHRALFTREKEFGTWSVDEIDVQCPDLGKHLRMLIHELAFLKDEEPVFCLQSEGTKKKSTLIESLNVIPSERSLLVTFSGPMIASYDGAQVLDFDLFDLNGTKLKVHSQYDPAFGVRLPQEFMGVLYKVDFVKVDMYVGVTRLTFNDEYFPKDKRRGHAALVECIGAEIKSIKDHFSHMTF